MADNILKGIIKLEASGVEQTARRVEASVNGLTSGFSKLSPALVKSDVALKSARNAGFAFNQILREAPAFAFSFQTGIIGISNNLPILVDALNKAKASGAGTGQILKDLALNLVSLPSILSIGALALAVFAGSSKKSKEETEGLNKASQEAKQRQDEFKNALDNASSSVLSQSGKIAELRNILVSTNSQFQGLTQNIINQGTAQFLFDKKNVELQKILNAEIQRRLELGKKSLGISASPFITDKAGSPEKLVRDINDAEQAVGILNRTAKQLGLTFENLVAPVKELKVKPEKITIDRPKIGDFNLELPTIFDFEKQDGRSRFRRQLTDLENSIRLNIPFSIDLSAPGRGFQNLLGRNAAGLAAIRKPAEDLGRSFSESFRNAALSSLSTIGEGIGNVLSGKNFGAGLIGVIGDLLGQLGKALLAYGAIKTGLDKILGPGGIAIPGAAAIALGVAAIAAGQAFKNFGGFRAAGGPVSSGKGYIVGEKGPEFFQPGINGSIIPNSQLSAGGSLAGSGGGRVVFEIAGNKLRGILKKADLSALGLE